MQIACEHHYSKFQINSMYVFVPTPSENRSVSITWLGQCSNGNCTKYACLSERLGITQTWWHRQQCSRDPSVQQCGWWNWFPGTDVLFWVSGRVRAARSSRGWTCRNDYSCIYWQRTTEGKCTTHDVVNTMYILNKCNIVNTRSFPKLGPELLRFISLWLGLCHDVTHYSRPI